MVNERLREERIRQYVAKGISANKIQVMLQDEGLGMRRKVLLKEIRTYKKQMGGDLRSFSESKPLIEEVGYEGCYRVTYIIRDNDIDLVPVHSTDKKPNYIGFRLTAFSFDYNRLNANDNYFKQLLVNLASDYLHYDVTDWDGFDFIAVSIEKPVFIPMTQNEALNFNNKWLFKVEQNGSEVDDNSGRW